MATLAAEDFELLLQANRILASKLDSDDLLQSVMELATRVVKAEASSILLLDEKTNELHFNVALGQAGRQVKQVRLKVGEGLAGWVAEQKKAAIVNDVQNDPRWSGRGDEKSEFKTHQVLAVPLIANGRLIGVMEGINKRGGGPFTEQDRDALEAFSSQAAVAIENARLFTEVKGEKEKLSTVFAEMTDGAILLNERGGIQLMNQAAGHCFGIEPSSAVGRMTLEDLLKGFMCVPPVSMALESADRALSVELKRREGKAFYLAGVMNRLSTAHGALTGHLFVVHDVTEQRREELLKRNFLSFISHKLKTPLVTIAGYAPLLLEEESSLTEFQKKALNTIRNQGLHLSSLVDKLLTFSLVESETLHLAVKPLPPKAIVADLLSSMRNFLSDRRGKVVTDPSLDTLPPVAADGDRVGEVLRNLVENAVKFTPGREKVAWIDGIAQGDVVRFNVRDKGPGIPPEERPRIFQKFYQIEESFTGQIEGVGLGLALARRIIEAHGGAIDVEPNAGRGSCFYFTLPRAK